MMVSYFKAFVAANKMKLLVFMASVAIYTALILVTLTLGKSIPKIAALPLQSIGVATMVQKTGDIPPKMVGAVFPHSNAPITEKERRTIEALPFVSASDAGIYSWFFAEKNFQAFLGVDAGSKIIKPLLQNNLEQGTMYRTPDDVLVTKDFATKRSLKVGETLSMGNNRFTVSGILRSNLSGNIIPADIYMDKKRAVKIVLASSMKTLYKMDPGTTFSNVLLLQSDAAGAVDKEKQIKAINPKLIVFSEKNFTQQIEKQLGLVSSFARIAFIFIGLFVVIAFVVMMIYNMKTREKEIAVLRMLGWSIRDIKKQFIQESGWLLGGAILLGNLLAFILLYVLSKTTVHMELPWDISARPHFLPAENAIERVISAPLPIAYDPMIALGVSFGFFLLIMLINYILLGRLRKIKPDQLAK